MRRAPLVPALLALLAPALAAAQASAPDDPLLERLVAESLAARPELRQARERARAERERVPQAGALPDPTLSLGLQNDGFDGLQIGKMEGSYYQVMLSQGLPWPGKRGLRTDVAQLAADAADAGVERVRLTTEADVRRGYLDLLLVRDRLALLDRLEAIWKDSSAVAQARYGAGEGAQSDVLRAQLELNRLRQRRWALQSDERVRVQALNRLRAHPLDEPIATTARVGDLPLPAPVAADAGFADAAARSPELRQARLEAASGEAGVTLARRDRWPDLSVSAGIMPRGALDPMWQAGVSVSLPVWAWRKQGRAVAESEARASAGASGAAAVEQVLRQRVAERASALAAALDSVKLYREGLLVQSKATAESTLAQYRVGRVTFASVLDANAGYVADEEGLLFALADALRIGIASAEVSLAPGAAGAPGAIGAASVPGAGALGSGGGGAAAGGAASAGGGGGGGGGAAMSSGM
ncbi:MAG TPA: TolC family protein [Anaeromyxobacteraceae bacterium]|nr:TolC family protein [Anaeromyxobacteraceae bacterium]